MELSPERAAEIEQNLIENELMRQGDHITHSEKGDYWEKLLCFYTQVRGYYYCTEESLIFVGGFAGTTFWSVRYQDIKEFKKCAIGPLIQFIPTGIRITFHDEKKGKDRKYKMSVLGRDKWMSFLGQKVPKNIED